MTTQPVRGRYACVWLRPLLRSPRPNLIDTPMSATPTNRSTKLPASCRFTAPWHGEPTTQPGLSRGVPQTKPLKSRSADVARNRRTSHEVRTMKPTNTIAKPSSTPPITHKSTSPCPRLPPTSTTPLQTKTHPDTVTRISRVETAQCRVDPTTKFTCVLPVSFVGRPAKRIEPPARG